MINHHRRRLFLSFAAFELLTFAIFAPLLLATSSSETNHQQKQQQYNNNHHRRTQRIAPLNVFFLIKDKFDLHRSQIENFVFQSLHQFATSEIPNNHNNQKTTLPSRLYTYDDFLSSLQTMSVDGIYGNSYHQGTNPYKPPRSSAGSNEYVNDPSNRAFYLSQDTINDFVPATTSSNDEGMTLAIVNICAFLANVMVEAIQFDTCDEFNGMMTGFDSNSGWRGVGFGNGPISSSQLSAVNGRYFPLSNACGQHGRSYQEEEGEECLVEDGVDVSCDVDPFLDMRASIHPRYNYIPGKTSDMGFENQPPPEFACGKKDFKGDYSGYWDGFTAEFVKDVAYPNVNGRIDVEGCCFWGRGALQTKGTCALGRFNYYFGRRAYVENRPSRYPNVDFCKIPVSLVVAWLCRFVLSLFSFGSSPFFGYSCQIICRPSFVIPMLLNTVALFIQS